MSTIDKYPGKCVVAEDPGLSPGTKLINLLSVAINNDNSTNFSSVSPIAPIGPLYPPTIDTLEAYSSLLDVSHLSPISDSSTSISSRKTVVEETKINTRSHSCSDPLPKVTQSRCLEGQL